MMKIIKYSSNKKAKLKRPVVALGVFDGVHCGHQALLKKIIERAKKINGTPVVVTFFPHPAHVLHKKLELSLLVSLEHRLALLKSFGVKACIVLNFTKKFASQNPILFVEKYLVGFIGAKEIVIGSNFHFGKNQKGSGEFLKLISSDYNFKVNIVSPVRRSKIVVSSSALRYFVAKGDLRKSEIFLNRKVSILGKVEKGDMRGKALGTPTANINPGREILPPCGVYLVEVYFDKLLLKAVANVGNRPSFKPRRKTNLEVHIFDFKRNIYGRNIEVRFLKKLRNEEEFSSRQKLIEQIEKDKRKALKLFAQMK